ncbi:MAG TPA: glycosyl hydrolase, partial [Bacteroidia bacterium]
GTNILELPPVNPSYSCELGALTNQATPDQTPTEVMSYLPSTNKMKYVNWFLDYSRTGTTPDQFPGPEVQHLIDNGYRPVITWEMMYEGYARLDPVQPRLDKIVNGYFDSYIDAFADRVKSYSDTVVMRIFHEFEGNWYCWSLEQNNQDPQLYASAFRHVVDRFRARGANKVKWMWCVNAEPKPYAAYNWIVPAYPGDNYVDIVAADIYNHPNTGVPPWKSFRYTLSENYFYLTKYFPNKPFYICEVGCRERYNSEPVASQTKGEWLCSMSRDLKTYFGRTRALVFFSETKEHDWRINSSPAALEAFKECIWQDNYFGNPVDVGEVEAESGFNVYPNPFTSDLHIVLRDAGKRDLVLNVYDITGKKVFSLGGNELQDELVLGEDLASGVYIVELRNDSFCRRSRVVKSKS